MKKRKNNRMNTLFPVILPVPDEGRQLSRKETVSYLSKLSREALKISARKTGVRLKLLLKNENGAPLSEDSISWSLTHKPGYVGGVVASNKIGIDIEKIRPCTKSLFKKTADELEWHLSDDEPFILFFRYWTAKESVLKAAGTGIRDLLKCRIKEVIDANHLTIDYLNKTWLIEHAFFHDHIASIVKNEYNINWILYPKKATTENYRNNP